jgi:ATP-dependent Clp protease ATP-binding subunit ClpC
MCRPKAVVNHEDSRDLACGGMATRRHAAAFTQKWEAAMTNQVPTRPRRDRYTDRYRRVLSQAAVEAAELDYDTVEPEHILLGLLAIGVSPGVRELSELRPQEVRGTVESLMGRGNQPESPDTLKASAETKVIAQLAAREADRLGDENVEPKHLLIGLLRASGRAARVLEGLGLSRDAILQQILGTET